MNEIKKNLHERAEQSTVDRLNEAKKHAIKNPNGQALKQVAVQEYILETIREKQERTAKDLCDLTCEQLGRLVTNSYIEGYEDCKAGREPIEKQEREKGCEYCEVDESGQMRLIWDCGLDHFEFNLSFCPNCGRKLKEDGQ